MLYSKKNSTYDVSLLAKIKQIVNLSTKIKWHQSTPPTHLHVGQRKTD